MNSKYNNFKNNIIYILLLIIFFISYYQMFSQHWSAHFDSDWFNIYNILLLKSGFKQDFYDHPAFTIFFINNLILRIYDYFDPNLFYSIEGAYQSENLNIFFEKIFYIARITNAFLHCGTILLLNKILNLLNKDKVINLIFLIVFIISDFYLINLFQIRPEIASVFFFLFSFYLILKNINQSLDYKTFLFSGFLIGLAFISKIQIIFFIFFIIFIIPLAPFTSRKNIENTNEKINQNIFKLLISIYLFICVSYIAILYFIIYNHPRYIDHQKIDLYGFLIFNLFYYFYIKFLSNNSENFFKIVISKYVLFFFGFLSSVLFLIFLNFTNLAPVNHNIYFKYLNPYYFLSNLGSDGTLINFSTSFLSIKLLIKNLFFILSLVLCIPFIKSILKKENFIVVICFGLVSLYVLSNNIRYFYLYEIYTFIAFAILFALTNKNRLSRYRYFVIIILLSSTIYSTFIKKNFLNYFNRESAFKNCDTLDWVLLKGEKGLDDWTHWTKKFDKNFYYKICKDIK